MQKPKPLQNAKPQVKSSSELSMWWYNFRREIFSLCRHEDKKIYAFRILGWFYDFRTFYYSPEEYERYGNSCKWHTMQELLDGSCNLSEWLVVPWSWKNGRSFRHSVLAKIPRAILWVALGWFLRSFFLVAIISIGINCSKSKEPTEQSSQEKWIEEIMIMRRKMVCIEFGSSELCMCKSGSSDSPSYFPYKCMTMKNMEVPILRRSF